MTNSLPGRLQDRTALVLYGSETGNAQDVAEELGRILERLRFLARVSELNAIGVTQLLQYTIIVIAVSTTGQGELPANAQTLWRSLRSTRLQPGCLSKVHFTTFGLGDSSYPKFNWAHRKLYNRLIQLGANAIVERGEADEQHPEGVDGAFLPWSLSLRRRLLEVYPLPNGIQPIPDDVLLQPKWTLEQAQTSLSNNGEPTGSARSPATGQDHDVPDDLLQTPGSLTVTLLENKRVTPVSHWQDVRHLIFETGVPVTYAPGDVLTIFPRNLPEDVDHLIKLMDWEAVADTTIQFVPTTPITDPSLYPPPPLAHLLPGANLTIRHMLVNYLDITSIPRRSFFALIAHFTKDTTQKDRLLEFTNPEYIDELYDYTTRPRRSTIEVLQEFYTVKIPWQWIGTVFPSLRGRQFSIASGGSLKFGLSGKTRIELLVAIVKYRTIIKKIRQGVCTRYIAALQPGQKINALLQKGGLHVSRAEVRRPVVMVGPGTGVAPMRSMIYERLHWKSVAHNGDLGPTVTNGVNGHGKAKQPLQIGKEVLFFGCRNAEADYFFDNEWEDMETRSGLHVYTAFSRDQEAKVYVQDRIRQESALVYDMLCRQLGLVYICGSSGKMPQAVREALIEVFQNEGRLPRGEAESYLVRMEKDGRYKQETW